MSQPEENRQKTPKTGQALRSPGTRREPDADRRDAEAREVVEVHGSDVRPGPEGDAERAVTTEPPD